jgi:DNA modification methylase
MNDYTEFLSKKAFVYNGDGITVDRAAIHPFLKPFQVDLTLWALRKGRAAIFADTGLGKTYMEAEWAKHISQHTGLPVLILAPLGVARQTVRLAHNIGMEVAYVRDQAEVQPGVSITNYEMLDHFDPAAFSGVVLDESSILKNLAGKTRQRLTAMFADTPYRLCGTATPAPNDDAEIGQHAEFLGIMSHVEMQATFFVHREPKDAVTGQKKKGARQQWNLRRHAEEKFYRWMASWGMFVRKPSDLGHSDDGYILPALNINPVYVRSDYSPDDQLFFAGLKGIGDRAKVRKATVTVRVPAVAELVNASDEQWLVWCGLNSEADDIADLIPGAVNVQGSDSIDSKTDAIEAFQDGRIRVLVTKPSIAGFGLNFQNAHNMAFVGLSDSWEDYYQCIRREYRFGQQYEVNAYIVLADIEDQIYTNIMRKEAQARNMADKLISHVQQYEVAELYSDTDINGWTYQTGKATGATWACLLGDSVERLAELADNSVDLSVFSPPFQSLYTYSPTERDLGNSRNAGQFNEHFGYIIDHLFRVIKPGRICAVHVADVPAMMVRDGYIGMKDFSGDVIRLFQERGWIFDARIPIDKNQQAQSIRTHSKALTMSQLHRDRSWLRPALPDYILKFRKPGENAVNVVGGVTGDEWIELANPTWPNEKDRAAEWGAWATWYGIEESDTLQGWQAARGNDDERHICPLQLGTIQRCIRLWTNPGETVLDPFNGIGSTGDQAIRLERKYIGIELKPEYWQVSVRNLKSAESDMSAVDLFTWAAQESEVEFA